MTMAPAGLLQKDMHNIQFTWQRPQALCKGMPCKDVASSSGSQPSETNNGFGKASVCFGVQKQHKCPLTAPMHLRTYMDQTYLLSGALLLLWLNAEQYRTIYDVIHLVH